MKSDFADQDLKEAFESLRNEDSRVLLPFQVSGSGRPRRWRAGPTSYAGGSVMLLAIFFSFVSPDPESPPTDLIAFEELTEIISRELFVISLNEWESPTDFLLDPRE